MGDRFYQAQLKELGTCPGYTGKVKRRMAWDDAKRAKVVKMYTESNPTPENSMEIVKQIADEIDESANGVRMVLSKAEVYVKKEGATAKTSSDKKPASTRVSKEAAQEKLIAAINDLGAEVDSEIVSKLTGKAALYLAGILETAGK